MKRADGINDQPATSGKNSYRNCSEIFCPHDDGPLHRPIISRHSQKWFPNARASMSSAASGSAAMAPVTSGSGGFLFPNGTSLAIRHPGVLNTSARADSQKRRSPVQNRQQCPDRLWGERTACCGTGGSVMRNRIDIDHIHSRAIVREIGERLRASLKPEPELPASLRGVCQDSTEKLSVL
jgi:hypothetical protein